MSSCGFPWAKGISRAHGLHCQMYAECKHMNTTWLGLFLFPTCNLIQDDKTKHFFIQTDLNNRRLRSCGTRTEKQERARRMFLYIYIYIFFFFFKFPSWESVPDSLKGWIEPPFPLQKLPSTWLFSAADGIKDEKRPSFFQPVRWNVQRRLAGMILPRVLQHQIRPFSSFLFVFFSKSFQPFTSFIFFKKNTRKENI